jgi:recombination protein RecR
LALRPLSSAYENLVQKLRKLPGIGYRSAERLALHLVVERPALLPEIVAALNEAGERLRRCEQCGNITEEQPCATCADATRDPGLVCVVESVPDLVAVERSASHRGRYHVLHGKLSPIRGVGPEQLNIEPLLRRIEAGEVREIILALSNDVEGEATCHYLGQELAARGASSVAITRIGFGLPSGGGVVYADAVTLKSALESRRQYH